MTPQQKHAWFNLIVFTTVLVAYLGLVPFVGTRAALGAMGLCGFWGLGVVFYRKKRGMLAFDERDKQIHGFSLGLAYAVFWVCFVAACMIPWGVFSWYGWESISIEVLPWLVFGGMIVVTVSQSVAILVKYGRSDAGATK